MGRLPQGKTSGIDPLRGSKTRQCFYGDRVLGSNMRLTRQSKPEYTKFREMCGGYWCGVIRHAPYDRQQ